MDEQVNSASDYVGNFFEHVVDGLPKFLGALAIVLIGYIVGKIVATVINKALTRVRLNEQLHTGKGGNIIQRAVPDPAHLTGVIAFWAIFLFAVSMAASALGIPALVQIVDGIYAYIPNIIAAVAIFLVAGAISTAVATLVANAMGDTPTGKIVGTAVPVLVMGLATFMILNQLKIAPEIVTITYTALVGSTALGMALAFGLGGKDVASTILQGLYENSKSKKDAAKSDFSKGAQEIKLKGEDLRHRL